MYITARVICGFLRILKNNETWVNNSGNRTGNDVQQLEKIHLRLGLGLGNSSSVHKFNSNRFVWHFYLSFCCSHCLAARTESNCNAAGGGRKRQRLFQRNENVTGLGSKWEETFYFPVVLVGKELQFCNHHHHPPVPHHLHPHHLPSPALNVIFHSSRLCYSTGASRKNFISSPLSELADDSTCRTASVATAATPLAMTIDLDAETCMTLPFNPV